MWCFVKSKCQSVMTNIFVHFVQIPICVYIYMYNNVLYNFLFLLDENLLLYSHILCVGTSPDSYVL